MTPRTRLCFHSSLGVCTWLQFSASWAARPLIFKPGQLPTETTCWDIPQPRQPALRSLRNSGSNGTVLGLTPAEEPGTTGKVRCAWQCPTSCARSWETGNCPQRARVGPLAAGMRPNSARFSNFGNHEAVPFMLAACCKTNFKKSKASWRLPRRPSRPGTPKPNISPAPKFS